LNTRCLSEDSTYFCTQKQGTFFILFDVSIIFKFKRYAYGMYVRF